MVKPPAGYWTLAYSSPEPVQTPGTVAYPQALLVNLPRRAIAEALVLALGVVQSDEITPIRSRMLEVLYPWHPWFGRVVHVHEVIEQRAGGVLRCSPDGDASRRWLELPQWMFDRAACLAIRMAASPRVDTTALIALKTCLADASDAGLCGGPLSNASASGAGRSSCNLNQGAARATQVPTSTQPSGRRQAVRSIRSARREAPDPGVRVATAAGEDPRDGDRSDGAPPHRPPTPRSRAQLDGKAR